MAFTIKWTKQASRTFHKTVEYIEEEWSERSAKKFVNKVNDFLQLFYSSFLITDRIGKKSSNNNKSSVHSSKHR